LNKYCWCRRYAYYFEFDVHAKVKRGKNFEIATISCCADHALNDMS